MGSNSHEEVGPEEGSSRRSSWEIDSQKEGGQHEGIEEKSDWDEGDQDEGDQDEGDQDEGDQDEGEDEDDQDDQDEDDQDEDDQDEGDENEDNQDEGDEDEGDEGEDDEDEGGEDEEAVIGAIRSFKSRAPESLPETFTVHEDREFLEWAIAGKVYFSPIDEFDKRLMSALHHIFRQLFDDRLVFPRLPGLFGVLECGFGTGEWATAVASKHPFCEVIALDISPYTLARTHPRVKYHYANLNERIPVGKRCFDFAHSQMMAGAIDAQRWESFIGEMFEALRKGGWCQLVELYPNAQSDNGGLTDEHALRQWSTSYLAGSESTGKDYRVYKRLAQILVNTGFVDVEELMLPLPLCAWRDDEAGRHLGGLVAAAVDGWLESLSLYPMTAVNGMPVTAWRKLVDRAVADARTPSLRPYFPIFVTIGRRPGGKD